MGEARAERLGPHPFADCAGYAQRCPARPGSAHETRAGLVATAGAVRTRRSFSAPTRASGSMKKPPRRLQSPQSAPVAHCQPPGREGSCCTLPHAPMSSARPFAPSHVSTLPAPMRARAGRAACPPLGFLPSEHLLRRVARAKQSHSFPGPIGMQHEWIIAARLLDRRFRRPYECLTQLLTDGFPNAS